VRQIEKEDYCFRATHRRTLLRIWWRVALTVQQIADGAAIIFVTSQSVMRSLSSRGPKRVLRTGDTTSETSILAVAGSSASMSLRRGRGARA